MEMTLAELKNVCKTLQLYNTPSLNDKLYLQCKGYRSIGPAIGEYSGVRSLWLESNGFDRIENLEKLVELRCLFINNNLIETIEGLDNNLELCTINLSNNHVKKIEGISHLPKLNTLHLASNRLASAEDLEHLRDCPAISVLDVSNNHIADASVVDIFASMPCLRVLHLSGNPCVRKIEHYRKTLVSRCVNLTYLDDRPVFEDERRCCNAWVKGGPEAEKAERELIRKEKDERERRNREAFRELLENARRKRDAERAATTADGERTNDENNRDVGGEEEEDKGFSSGFTRSRASLPVLQGSGREDEVSSDPDWEYDGDLEIWLNQRTGERFRDESDRENNNNNEVVCRSNRGQIHSGSSSSSAAAAAVAELAASLETNTVELPPKSRFQTDDIFGEDYEPILPPEVATNIHHESADEEEANKDSKNKTRSEKSSTTFITNNNNQNNDDDDNLPDDLPDLEDASDEIQHHNRRSHHSNDVDDEINSDDDEEEEDDEEEGSGSCNLKDIFRKEFKQIKARRAKEEAALARKRAEAAKNSKKKTSMKISESTIDDDENNNNNEEDEAISTGHVVLQMLQDDLKRVEIESSEDGVEQTDMDELD